ncbi:unnamed protein product [Musa textilis]
MVILKGRQRSKATAATSHWMKRVLQRTLKTTTLKGRPVAHTIKWRSYLLDQRVVMRRRYLVPNLMPLSLEDKAYLTRAELLRIFYFLALDNVMELSSRESVIDSVRSQLRSWLMLEIC